MSMTDDLLGMSDQDKKDYAESENHASEIERADDEWDIDETCFKDGEITLEDLKTSPIYKAQYSRYLSTSNWIRWCLL